MCSWGGVSKKLCQKMGDVCPIYDRLLCTLIIEMLRRQFIQILLLGEKNSLEKLNLFYVQEPFFWKCLSSVISCVIIVEKNK